MHDPRTTLARDGVAALSLKGVVAAERYVATVTQQAALPSASLRRGPSPEAEQLDQLLYGELFEVLDEAGGWSFGQAVRDGYVGYVETAALGPPQGAPTHTVRALRTFGFTAPSIKAPPTGLFSMNALLAAEGRDGRFVQTAAGLFVEEHLVPVDRAEVDHVAVAERYVGTPYLWGGRESLGLDCSGLVQQALYACGRTCPRDSDQQEAMGTPVEVPQRGDLVFWPGHVAIMTNGEAIIHASGWHMEVVVEPLAEATLRIQRLRGGELIGFRRL